VAKEIDRRAFLTRGGLTLAGLNALTLGGLTAFLASCGSDTSSAGGTATASEDGVLTLRMPFLLDMQIPDPDVMYEGEGLQVMLSAYEGLVNYKPGTGDIVSGLAKSWTVSDDRLTYTFTLFPDVKFHDGTPADAAAWAKSFQRRHDVNQGGAYMVADVASTATPDATTFVVTLKQPNDAFLDYLACPWQPYAVSPTAVAKNAVGDDLSQEWLKTHDAGTGPYVLSEFVPSSHYLLDAFDGYWGPAPQFKQVRIEIVPDVTTQRLQLEAGDLDLVTKGFATEDVLAFQKNKDFQVIVTQATSVVALYMNATSGMFTDKPLRQAFLHSLDRPKLVEPTYQGLATMETNYFTENMFPPGLAPFDLEYDPSLLKALVPGLDSNKVDLAYAESGGAPARRMAELIQTQLAPLGLDVTVRGVPSSQVFAFATGDADQRPDLLLWSYGGDALHVDTVLRIFFKTGAAPLNWAQYSNTEIDTLMDEALTKLTEDEVNQTYVDIAKILQDEAWFIPFCRRPEAIIARTGLTNFVSNSYLPSIISAAALKEA